MYRNSEFLSSGHRHLEVAFKVHPGIRPRLKLKQRNPDTFDDGHYILNGTDIPVIFCEDITTMSGRSIDNLVDVVRNSLNFA